MMQVYAELLFAVTSGADLKQSVKAAAKQVRRLGCLKRPGPMPAHRSL